MKINGERVKVLRWVHSGPYAVHVEVDAVVPSDDPSEPCLEPAAVEFLREVHDHVQRGDVEWLKRIGRVYLRLSA